MKRETVARGLRRAVVAVAAASLLTGLAACGGDADRCRGRTSAAANPEGIDDGTTLTLWTRAPLEKQANLLVEAYNATHKNQVELTVVPNDDYVAKVGRGGGLGGLPDLFAADIVYVPNWVEQGLFQDITANIDALPVQGHDQPGPPGGRHVRGQGARAARSCSTCRCCSGTRTLFEEAGLDPEKAPATLEEFAEPPRRSRRWTSRTPTAPRPA